MSTTTDIALRNPSVPTAADMQASVRYAEHLALSGLLPTAYRQKPANVLYAIEYGRMIGLAPMAAITGVHVIEGKPSASAALISALVRRAGHKLRVRGDAKSAWCQIVRCDDPDYAFEVTFTMEDARAAKLTNKEVWQKYPAAMLKARAISQCARDACEEALFGLHYTPEELGREVDEEGLPVVSVEQAAEKMRRDRADDTAEDDWSTDPAEAQQSAAPKPSTHAQRTKLVILVKAKRGVIDDAERRSVIGQLVGREIASSKDLTLVEASKAIDALEAEPDHIADAEVIDEPAELAPNPANGDRPVPAVTAAALWAPTLDTLVTRAETEGGKPVVDQLRDLIGDAPTPEHINRVGQLAAEARDADHISPKDFGGLAAVVKARREALGLVGDEAPTAEQYEARDALEKRVRSAYKPDAFTDVYGAMVDAEAAGNITKVQCAALTRMLDARYEGVKARWSEQQRAEAGRSSGWSHSHPVARGLAEATAGGAR